MERRAPTGKNLGAKLTSIVNKVHTPNQNHLLKGKEPLIQEQPSGKGGGDLALTWEDQIVQTDIRTALRD